MFSFPRLLNLGLAALLLALAVSFYEIADWGKATDGVLEQGASNRPAKAKIAVASYNPRPGAGGKEKFENIAAKDLFNPERKLFEGEEEEREAEEEPAPEKTEPPKGVVLTGTIITQNLRFALFNDPAVNEGRGKRYVEGDQIEDFTIKEIRQDRVVLNNAQGREVVMKLYNPDAKAQKGKKAGKAGGRKTAGPAPAEAGQRQGEAAPGQTPGLQQPGGAAGQPNAPAAGAGGRRSRTGGPLPFLPAQMK